MEFVSFGRSDHGEYAHSFDIAVSPNLTGRTPRSGKGFDRSKKRYVIRSSTYVFLLLLSLINEFIGC